MVTLLCAYAPGAMASIAITPNLSFIVSPSFLVDTNRALARFFVKQRLPRPGFEFIQVVKMSIRLALLIEWRG
ncbi:hypothetical protein [Burkholderia diffusa]|uniref:hypothetical protein n=1 Tax=Burkholderia diffusa TaxID=488732 RepID=UPI0018C5AF7E|nr:hypothetical protein [Burkholderia diffusa]